MTLKNPDSPFRTGSLSVLVSNEDTSCWAVALVRQDQIKILAGDSRSRDEVRWRVVKSWPITDCDLLESLGLPRALRGQLQHMIKEADLLELLGLPKSTRSMLSALKRARREIEDLERRLRRQSLGLPQ